MYQTTELKNAMKVLAIASSNVMDLLRDKPELFEIAKRIDSEIDDLITYIEEEED